MGRIVGVQELVEEKKPSAKSEKPKVETKKSEKPVVEKKK